MGFINKEVQSGRYNSVSEVIRSALRLLEKEDKKEQELIKALKEGEQSQTIENFTLKQISMHYDSKHL